MQIAHIEALQCPDCGNTSLRYAVFLAATADAIKEGVVWCEKCRSWFPIQNFILDFLTENLAYTEKRRDFAEKHKKWFSNNENILIDKKDCASDVFFAEKKSQQAHSDWFGDNDELTYEEYVSTPFLRACIAHTGKLIDRMLPGNQLILEVGCGVGTHTPKLASVGADVIAFDISTVVVNQAVEYFRKNACGNNFGKASFLLADAMNIPVKNEIFDSVMILGVLHHLPNPKQFCAEMVRVLNGGGGGDFFSAKIIRVASVGVLIFYKKFTVYGMKKLAKNQSCQNRIFTHG